MPAKSEAQQKLFGIVHAYQTGRIPANKISPKIKKIAASISPEDAKKYASTSHAELKEVLHTILHSPKYTELTLSEIVKTQNPSMVKGQLIDVFTAQLLCTVMTKLNENNKNDLLQCPVNQMVAVAYKILTY